MRAQGLGCSPFDVSSYHPPFESDSRLFTKEMYRPFSCSMSSGTLKFSGEIDRLSFSFIDLCVPALTPRIHCSESLKFAENTFVFFCRVNTGISIFCKQNKMSSRCGGVIIYIWTVQCWDSISLAVLI
jgi:hypothetical protein